MLHQPVIKRRRDSSANPVLLHHHHHHHEHARTTIINHKQISKVIECYSTTNCQFNPLLNSSMIVGDRVALPTSARSRGCDNRHVFDEDSFVASLAADLCRSCKSLASKQRHRRARFCKCCGRPLGSKSCSTSSVAAAADSIILTLRNQQQQSNKYRKQQHQQQQQANNQDQIFISEKCQLKKFKAMSNIKRKQNSQVKSFSTLGSVKLNRIETSAKRPATSKLVGPKRLKHLKKSRISRTNSDDDDATQQHGLRLSKLEEYLKNLQQTCSSFQVDFASTPIKTAPKTSTPKKNRMDAKSF